MGWSTDLYCHIYFHKETYDTIYKVENAIDECKALINLYKEKLHNFAVMTEPRKFCSDEDDPLAYINIEVNNALEGLSEETIRLYNLNLLLDNWNKCHTSDGLAIPLPDNIKWDSAFLDGDFIKTTKNPDLNEHLC